MVAITRTEFQLLASYIRDNYGIHLKEEKEALVNGRLHHILEQKNFSSFAEYYDYIVSDKTGAAAATLIDKITTNHTFFMREPDHFFFLRDQVLPLFQSILEDHDLRIWSAGCATGEEPYTLAMIVDEFFGEEKLWWDTKILATDISNEVLCTARRGIYSNERIAVLPPAWRLNYFNRADTQNSIVIEKIRNEIIFRAFNLMDRVFPFKRKFHAIFCRNVMIYFDNETKDKLVEKLYESTEYGGYLFIGHSESIDRQTSKYKYIMPAVYRKL